MTDNTPDVKTPSRQFANWLDHHPRTGWYVAIWALLMTANQVWLTVA